MKPSITKRLNFASSVLAVLASTESEFRSMCEYGRAIDVVPAAFQGQGMAAHPYDLDDIANDIRRIAVELRRMAAKMYAEADTKEEGIAMSLFPDPDKAG